MSTYLGGKGDRSASVPTQAGTQVFTALQLCLGKYTQVVDDCFYFCFHHKEAVIRVIRTISLNNDTHWRRGQKHKCN